MREELLHLLTLSGTLAGLCTTGVTLFHTIRGASPRNTIADDALALSALMFLLCTYAIFFALRSDNPRTAARLEWAVDVLFSVALTAMVATGFIMVYTVW